MNRSATINPGILHVERLTVLLIGLFLLFFFPDVNAQYNWSLSIKSGMHITTENIDEADLKTGYGVEGALFYSFTNFFSAYGGWGWNKFKSARSFAGDDVEFEEIGYTFGAQFNYPATGSKVTYLVGLGGLYNHLEIEDQAGSIIADSGHGLGAQAETGLILLFGKHFQLIPYGRYRSLPVEFELDHTVTRIDLKYLSFGVGLCWTL